MRSPSVFTMSGSSTPSTWTFVPEWVAVRRRRRRGRAAGGGGRHRQGVVGLARRFSRRAASAPSDAMPPARAGRTRSPAGRPRRSATCPARRTTRPAAGCWPAAGRGRHAGPPGPPASSPSPVHAAVASAAMAASAPPRAPSFSSHAVPLSARVLPSASSTTGARRWFPSDEIVRRHGCATIVCHRHPGAERYCRAVPQPGGDRMTIRHSDRARTDDLDPRPRPSRSSTARRRLARPAHAAAVPGSPFSRRCRPRPGGAAPRHRLRFLWAFLDKAFGLGYATPSGNAWINGGSPTRVPVERRRRPVRRPVQRHRRRAGPTGCSCSACSDRRRRHARDRAAPAAVAGT